MSSRLAGKGACACVYARFPTSGFGRCPERTYGRRDVEAAQDDRVAAGFTVIRPCGGCRMWKLYCLPGRVIAEFGYLFPGRGQIWASRRRRESGFAAFLFATGFWIAFWLFIGPMFIGAIKNAVNAGRQTSTAATARSAGVSSLAPTPGVVAHLYQRRVDKASTQTTDSNRSSSRPALGANITADEPRVVFATPHEVVEPLPGPTQPTNTANQ